WQTPAGGQAPARGRLRSPPASHRVVGAGSTGERPGGVVPDGGATAGPPTGPPLGLDAPKSTVGGVATACSSVTVKFGFTWKSNIFAVRLVGKLRTLMLYWRTASMYRLRATVMRFSVPSSCTCRSRKFSFDFRSGYASATAIRLLREAVSWFCAAWNFANASGSFSSSGVS